MPIRDFRSTHSKSRIEEEAQWILKFEELFFEG